MIDFAGWPATRWPPIKRRSMRRQVARNRSPAGRDKIDLKDRRFAAAMEHPVFNLRGRDQVMPDYMLGAAEQF
jgi:hypothetical protein